MAIEQGRAWFRSLGMEDRVLEFAVSSATVDLAAIVSLSKKSLKELF